MLFDKKNKKGDEITRYGFVSNTEAYIDKLLSDPVHAKTSEYLKSFGITGEKLLPLLLKKDDDDKSILSRKEKIKTDKETKKDRFSVKYKLNDKTGVERQLRNLYIKLFEYYVTDANLLKEDGEGGAACGGEGGGFSNGANSASQSGQYSAPINGKKDVIRRTFYVTEEQLKAIQEAVTCDNSVGQYDVPAFNDKETSDHSNMFAKSIKDGE